MSIARVAVVGAGISGFALAAALAHGARVRSRKLEVRVFGTSGLESPSPLLLTRECRARLMALGCADAPEGLSLAAVEVLAGQAHERFSTGREGLWVVDRPAVVRLLAGAAAQEGARHIPRNVDAIAPDDRPEGALVVHSQGSIERFGAVVLAVGAGEAHWPLEGEPGPPTLPSLEAELVSSEVPQRQVSFLIGPSPGVQGLYVVPGVGKLHVLAFGPKVAEADLGQALMLAAGQGLIPSSFRLGPLRSSRISAGAGRSLIRPGVLAVGPAALGHPLQLGLSAALASCSRVAAALLDSEGKPGELRRLVRGGLTELEEAARFGTRAAQWLVRAGARAPSALSRARGFVEPGCCGGVLGLPSPAPLALLRSARWSGLAQMTRELFLLPEEPPGLGPSAETSLVYVVEDDDEVREALSHFLRSQGAEVVAFCDELSLFAAMARRQPAAVVLDVVLRRVDGLRLCECLKRHPVGRQVKVLVTSGLDRPHVRARALAAGACAFLPKPLNPNELWAALGLPSPSAAPEAKLRADR